MPTQTFKETPEQRAERIRREAERDPLERLKELHQKGTPGPWRVANSELVHIYAPKGHGDEYGMAVEAVGSEMDERAWADASLIAELRNHAASLLEIASAARNLFEGYKVNRASDGDSDINQLTNALAAALARLSEEVSDADSDV